MIEAPYINPSIAPFIPAQFDFNYRDNNPLYVAFVQAYYEWCNDTTRAGGAVGYTRDFLELRDVDRSTAQFLVHIKQKFLDDLQLQTESDTRQLIKHAKDLYRAKGSKRALDLFFRLLYDEVISVYYPKVDLLVPSSAVYVKPTYLELSLSTNNPMLEGKQIVGLSSKATGFVDGIIRRLLGDKLADTAYISAVTGTFQTGEIVVPTDGSMTVPQSPTIVGSLNTLLFDQSGSGVGYNVGDIVPVNSASGVNGLARISDTVTQTGLITLQLGAGGYGYTNNTQLVVADTILNLDGITLSNAYARKYFQFYETLTQPLANLTFHGANGTFATGDTLSSYGAGGANAKVLSVSYTNATAGSLLIATTPSTNLASNGTFYNQANAVTAAVSVAGYVDQTATGWLVGFANLVLSTTNVVGSFLQGENITQHRPGVLGDQSAQGTGQAAVVSSNFLSVTNRKGVYRPGQVFGETSGATATVTDVAITIGVKLLNNAFVTLPGNMVFGLSVSNATVNFQGSGTTATFGFSNALAFTESVQVNTDSLASIANKPLAGPYSLPGNTSANATSNFSNYLTFANVTVGAIQNVFTITPGTQFDAQPIVSVLEPNIATLNEYDVAIRFTGATASFVVGETITQAATSGRALITQVNATAMLVTNMRFDPTKSIIPTINSTTTILGNKSGAVANVSGVYADHDDNQTGRNALAVANTITSSGAVVAATVVDSGFGFQQNEEVWLGDGSQNANDAVAIVQLQTMGTGRGFFTQNDGFMSSNKVFFDGDFYQNFSYEISAAHQLSEYVETLKRVVHVAGMKVFGRYVHDRKFSGVQRTAGSVLTTINHNQVAIGSAVGHSTAQANASGVTSSKGLTSGVGAAIANSSQIDTQGGAASGAGSASAVGVYTIKTTGSASGAGGAQSPLATFTMGNGYGIGNSAGQAIVSGKKG